MLKLLITEDKERIRAANCRGIQQFGFAVDGAENGKVALAKLHAAREQGEPFDAILVDLHMPVMNGWDLLRELDNSYQELCRVIYTATVRDAENMAAALEIGAQFFLTAGVPFEDIPLFIKAGVAEKRTESWKYQALANLDCEYVLAGMIDIISDTIGGDNVFVAICEDPSGEMVVERESAVSSGRRSFTQTIAFGSLLADRPVAILRKDVAGSPLQEVGARLADTTQLLLSRILAPGGALLGVVGLEDKTERQIPACYQKVIRDLSTVGGAAITAIRRARAEIELLRSVNHEFAHWINSPLQVLAYAVDAIAEDAADTELSASEPFARHLDDICNATSEIRRIQARMRHCEESISVEFEDIDLCSVARDCCREYESRVEIEDIELRVQAEDPAPVAGDPQRLRYLIRVLLDNAMDAITVRREIEPAPHQGRVTVDVVADCAALQACLRITDNGAGVSQDLRSQLFLPLFTTKEELSETHGIGLFSARRVALMHHGSLQLERTAAGGGSTFCLRMPLRVGVGHRASTGSRK